jgi:hypothetical protein
MILSTLKCQAKNFLYPSLKLKPGFLIVGAAKAGTTSLFRYLCAHPQIVCPSNVKELNYFSNEDNYAKGLGWYLTAFPYKLNHSRHLTFEATPHYLYYTEAPKRIRDDLGDIKIIVSLREPSTRAYSSWKMFNSFSNNKQKHLRDQYDDRTFSEAISNEIDNQAPPELKRHKYIDYGLYEPQVRRYFDRFGRENVIVFDYNRLFEPFSLMDKITNFLSIKPYPEEISSNTFYQKYNRSKISDVSEEDRATLNFLYRYFIPHNISLYKLIGEDFNW